MFCNKKIHLKICPLQIKHKKIFLQPKKNSNITPLTSRNPKDNKLKINIEKSKNIKVNNIPKNK